MASTRADKSKPYFPLAGGASDGFSRDGEATATCYCGGIQIAFPTEKPGLVTTLNCSCSDCRKITAAIFAANFSVKDEYMRHIRGKELLKTFGPQAETIRSGHTMSNHFCSVCGTLMFRISSGYPGISIMRVGTVDDQLLAETKLRPRVEQFIENRVAWLPASISINQFEGMGIGRAKARL